MRKQSRITLGVIGLSTLTTSYLLGHQGTESALNLAANATTQTTGNSTGTTSGTQVTSPATTDTSVTATPTDTATATPSATATATPEATATSTPSATATHTQTATPTPTAVSGTFTSKMVNYRYGQVQLQISVTDGALTDIQLLTATTEGRGYDQAPPILVQAALNAGGSNFGNLSGATFVTQAFKQALNDALAQAGL